MGEMQGPYHIAGDLSRKFSMSAGDLAKAVLNQAFADVMGRAFDREYRHMSGYGPDPTADARMFLISQSPEWWERREFWCRVAGRDEEVVREEAIATVLAGRQLKGNGSSKSVTR
jgi:hypothetical protein